MIEMTIESIRVSLRNYQRVVILREQGSDRYLPIWIGPAEADAIAVRLQEQTVARPLTHDLLNNVIGEFGATVKFVIVNDLENDTFFAKINVEHNGETLEVDSRPSDAIALAPLTERVLASAARIVVSGPQLAGIRHELGEDHDSRWSSHKRLGDRKK